MNGLRNVYGNILEAVSEFPEMQMVLSAGRNFNPRDLGPIPSKHRPLLNRLVGAGRPLA